MLALLIYDVEDDAVRTRLAKACLNAGLERVQYSAFWGELSDNCAEELWLRCQELLGAEPGRIHLFPLCRKCFAARRLHANEPYAADSARAPATRHGGMIFPSSGPAQTPRRPSGGDSDADRD